MTELTTSVAEVFMKTLDDPKLFSGRTVVAREPATYTSYNPNHKTRVITSEVTDKVLLSDETEVYQCKTCGKHWDNVLSAQSHVGYHKTDAAARQRTRRENAALKNKKAMIKPKATALRNTQSRTTVAQSTDTIKTVPPNTTTTDADENDMKIEIHSGPVDVPKIIDELDAASAALSRISRMLLVNSARLKNLSDEERNKISDADLEDLRRKAQQFDTIQSLLSN